MIIIIFIIIKIIFDNEITGKITYPNSTSANHSKCNIAPSASLKMASVQKPKKGILKTSSSFDKVDHQ